MDGSILGYNEDDGEGAIRTENGERYTFTKDDWKGERPPKAGDKVDFVGADGKASEIYLLKGSFSGPDLSSIGDKLGDKFGTAESRAEMLGAVKGNAAIGPFLTKPHVAGAGLIILGWLLAGHLLLIMDVMEQFDGMAELNRIVGRLDGYTGIGFFRSLGILSQLLFYLIPLLAGLLIYKSFNDSETMKDKRRGAFAGLGLPIATPVIGFILIFIGLPREGQRAIERFGFSLGDLIDPDFAFWVMIAGGVLIVLQMLGILKSFGGSK
ncbi:MAG: hypothetical protein AAGG45_07555 [Pseudomonadota bacterium]